MFGFFLSKNICIAVTYLIPAYQTFKTLRRSSLNSFNPYVPANQSYSISPFQFFKEIEEQQQWLRYWIVVGIFAVAEFYLDIFVYFVPFYYEAKILFVIWLNYSKGAEILYNSYIEPKLSTNEEHIDLHLQDLKQQTLTKLWAWGSIAFVYVQRLVSVGLVEGQAAMMQRSQMNQNDLQARRRSRRMSRPISGSYTNADVPNEMEEEYEVNSRNNSNLMYNEYEVEFDNQSYNTQQGNKRNSRNFSRQ